MLILYCRNYTLYGILVKKAKEKKLTRKILFDFSAIMMAENRFYVHASRNGSSNYFARKLFLSAWIFSLTKGYPSSKVTQQSKLLSFFTYKNAKMFKEIQAPQKARLSKKNVHKGRQEDNRT